jgi:hypothetical protein
LVADLGSATTLLDTYNFGVLHITAVDVNLKLRRELRQAFLLGVHGPTVVRRGRDVRVTLRGRRVRGAKFSRRVRVHVPRGLAAGEHVLTLTGTPADGGGDTAMPDLAGVFTLTLGDQTGTSGDEAGPKTLGALADAFAATAREDGVTASFRDPGDSDGSSATPDIEVLRDPNLRISGSATLRVEVRP